ncbi:MAG: transposase [Neptuniibacter sp.]
MSRALRIEFPGAYYHITSRGNARSDIYLNEECRRYFLTLLQQVCERFRWFCHAYCLMDNHYHLLIETAEANLSKGMRQLNGVYTQWVNRTFGRVGHLFQGRYKAILVDSDSYLTELCRYIVLNPVRARMCHEASEWPWSSYRATAGLCHPYDFLKIEAILASFDVSYGNAQEKYRHFVSEGLNQPSPWESLTNQIYLGSDAFIDEVQCKIDPSNSLENIPRLQKSQPKKPLPHYEQRYDMKSAIIKAYRSGHYTLQELGDYYGWSKSTISRVVNKDESN